MSSAKRNQDFQIVEKSAELLTEKLQQDEKVPDLDEQFRSQDPGHQRYFVWPYKNEYWGEAIDHANFVPLPQRVRDQYQKVESASFMGLLPEINCAWITVDNKLFLWNYLQPQACELFEGLTETIISVSLSAPKPGVFQDTVKYVLVLATAVEVVLLAISLDPQGPSYKMSPPLYSVPTDNVIMVKVVGSQSGRIFMAGNNGNMYELDYQSYEGTWARLFGAGPQHKCQKINHSAWKLVNVMPPFLRSVLDMSDCLEDICVDDIRCVLYTVSQRGVLSAFYLGADCKSAHPPLKREFRLFDELKAFGQHNDIFRDRMRASPLRIVGLYVIPLTESRKVHLMVLLNTGIRVYLRLVATDGQPYTPADSVAVPGQGQAGLPIRFYPPDHLQIVHVRLPPHPDDLRGHSNRSRAEQEGGREPAYLHDRELEIQMGIYSHGLLVTAMSKSTGTTRMNPGAASIEGDELMCIFEDLAGRSQLNQGLTVYATQSPSMREGVCVPRGNNGYSSEGKFSLVRGKIHDIRESCLAIHSPEAAILQSLFVTSAFSVAYNVAADDSPHPLLKALDFGVDASECVVGPAAAIAPAAQPAGFGLPRNDLGRIASMSELARQHIPLEGICLQRQVLVLTNMGIHTLQKVRPADYLYRFLSQDHYVDSPEDIKNFYALYGTVQAAVMCLAIACGLPADAGGAKDLRPTVCMRDPAGPTVQSRAMSILRTNASSEPSYKQGHLLLQNAPAAGGPIPALLDARVVAHPTGGASDNTTLCCSPLHDAFYVFVSRLLRPVWQRSVVCTPPSTAARGPGSGKATLASLWTHTVIDCLRSPLVQLLHRLEEMYTSSVVHADPLPTPGDGGPRIAAGRHMVVREMELNPTNQQRNPERARQHQALLCEETSIRGLYRLVGRAVQALCLIDILRTAQDDDRLSMDWTKFGLGKISFRALVVSSVVHDKMKKLLNDMINGTHKQDKGAVAENLSLRLSADCYGYFSAGDRYSYEATKILDRLQKEVNRSLSQDAPQVAQQVRNAVDLLCRAAFYWRSLDDVRDNHMNGNGAGGGVTLSPLTQRCQVLMRFGVEGQNGLIRLCAAAAKNFETTMGGGGSGIMVLFEPGQGPGVGSPLGLTLPPSQRRDQGLYHGGAILKDDDCLEGRTACYERFLHAVRQLRTVSAASIGGGAVGHAQVEYGVDDVGATRMKRQMIEQGLAMMGEDALFRDLLFESLATEDPDLLIRLTPSVYLEQFLGHPSQEPMLLYKYYRLHEWFPKAAAYMYQLAQQDGDLNISGSKSRIEYLNLAVNAATTACSYVSGGPSGMGGGLEAEILMEIESKHKIANLQYQAFVRLQREYQDLEMRVKAAREPFSEKQKKQIDDLGLTVSKLQWKLLTVVELFNDIALPPQHCLWDICVLLLHVTRTDDPNLVFKLVKSIIYRIIPERARTPVGESFLTNRRTGGGIYIDYRRQEKNSYFEDHAIHQPKWSGVVKDELTELGQHLLGPRFESSSSPLPIRELINELEEIASTAALANAPLQRGWTIDVIHSMGITYGVIVEHLFVLLQQWQAEIPEHHTHLLSSLTYALMEWRKTCLRYSASAGGMGGDVASTMLGVSSNETDAMQMEMVLRNGWMLQWLGKIKHDVSTIQESQAEEPSLVARKKVEIDAEVDLMKQFVDEKTIG